MTTRESIAASWRRRPGYLDTATYGLPPRQTVELSHRVIDDWRTAASCGAPGTTPPTRRATCSPRSPGWRATRWPWGRRRRASSARSPPAFPTTPKSSCPTASSRRCSSRFSCRRAEASPCASCRWTDWPTPSRRAPPSWHGAPCSPPTAASPTSTPSWKRRDGWAPHHRRHHASHRLAPAAVRPDRRRRVLGLQVAVLPARDGLPGDVAAPARAVPTARRQLVQRRGHAQRLLRRAAAPRRHRPTPRRLTGVVRLDGRGQLAAALSTVGMEEVREHDVRLADGLRAALDGEPAESAIVSIAGRRPGSGVGRPRHQGRHPRRRLPALVPPLQRRRRRGDGGSPPARQRAHVAVS